MKTSIKEQLNKAAMKELKPTTILVIKSRPILKAIDKGMELNEGYDFEVNGALPEIADGIAKFAIALESLEDNGFGEKSGAYFISLINDYFNKLQK